MMEAIGLIFQLSDFRLAIEFRPVVGGGGCSGGGGVDAYSVV